MRSPVLVLLAFLLLGAGCGGDSETASRADDSAGAAEAGGDARPEELSDVRDAEDEGRAYPTAQLPDRTFPTFGEDLPGTQRRECVQMTAGTPAAPGAKVRSGEFVAAVMHLYDEAGSRFAKIPWESLHLREEYLKNGGEVRHLEVRSASLSEPTKIATFREENLASAGEGAFYASGTPLPGEGPWRMIATSGPDWGCFDLKPPRA